MATTRLTDVVPVKVFEKIVEGKLTENSKFRQSNVVNSTDPRFAHVVGSAGFEATLPFWKRPVGGEALSQSDNDASNAVPNKVTQGSMQARVISRSLSFSAMDIADYASDADAIEFAAGEFARLRVSDEESTILATLKGCVGAGGAGYKQTAHITTGTIAAANKMGGTNLLGARGKLGDLGSSLKAIVMHSDVVNNLRAAEPNAFVPASQTNIGLETYMGYSIIETDNVGIDTTVPSYPVYTSYLVGPDLFGYASGSLEHALVQFRNELAGDGSGQEIILNRFRYVLHPYGFSNVVAPTNNVSQANTQIATAATWNVVAQDRKSIPLVAITTNG